MKFTLILTLLAALLIGCTKSSDSHSHQHHDHDHHGHDHGSHDHGDHAHAVDGLCVTHNVPETECGICRPRKLAPGESLKVRLPSGDSARLTGITTAPAATGAISDTVECYAELAFNQNRLAQIVAPVAGILQEVQADLGDHVTAGQTVAKIWSAQIAETVAKAVLSHQTLERERKLRAAGIAPAKDLEEAEAAHRAACQQARLLGFSEEDIDALAAQPDPPAYLAIRAPIAGTIIARDAVRGAHVDAGHALFTIADRSTMWATLNVPESALPRLQLGQTVELQLDALPDRTFTGQLTWIAAEVDERSRLARARAEFANTDGALRARMFGRARILTRAATSAVVVPAAAIQYVEATPVVFVKLADDLYEARGVRLGATHNGSIEVLTGLNVEEPVVVQQSFLIKSQFLASRLGAGCAHE
ncbi:MAG: efflux RND transporter periplasmic adaptor subunit [Verrucomicrobiae bacterium]|nr:efflux RND transporter periplasmic adaptor subunit [Verrucomicrobiae bacterium]